MASSGVLDETPQAVPSARRDYSGYTLALRAAGKTGVLRSLQSLVELPTA